MEWECGERDEWDIYNGGEGNGRLGASQEWTFWAWVLLDEGLVEGLKRSLMGLVMFQLGEKITGRIGESLSG